MLTITAPITLVQEKVNQQAIPDTGIRGGLRFTGIISVLSEINAAKEPLGKAIVELKSISETDPLTKIPNRRVYE